MCQMLPQVIEVFLYKAASCLPNLAEAGIFYFLVSTETPLSEKIRASLLSLSIPPPSPTPFQPGALGLSGGVTLV